jgi:hypothetical protein
MQEINQSVGPNGNLDPQAMFLPGPSLTLRRSLIFQDPLAAAASDAPQVNCVGMTFSALYL